MRRVIEKELKEIGEGRSLLEKRKENNLKKKERREAYAKEERSLKSNEKRR